MAPRPTVLDWTGVVPDEDPGAVKTDTRPGTEEDDAPTRRRWTPTRVLLTAVVTFAVTGAIYEGVVRRVAVLRGIFGVEPPAAEPSELPPGLSMDPEGARR